MSNFLHFLSWVRYLSEDEKGRKLKLKDGQIQLGIKELEFAKIQRGDSNLREAENKKLKEENAKLVV
jgi:hypothetical protein